MLGVSPTDRVRLAEKWPLHLHPERNVKQEGPAAAAVNVATSNQRVTDAHRLPSTRTSTRSGPQDPSSRRCLSIITLNPDFDVKHALRSEGTNASAQRPRMRSSVKAPSSPSSLEPRSTERIARPTTAHVVSSASISPNRAKSAAVIDTADLSLLVQRRRAESAAPSGSTTPFQAYFSVFPGPWPPTGTGTSTAAAAADTASSSNSRLASAHAAASKRPHTSYPHCPSPKSLLELSFSQPYLAPKRTCTPLPTEGTSTRDTVTCISLNEHKRGLQSVLEDATEQLNHVFMEKVKDGIAQSDFSTLPRTRLKRRALTVRVRHLNDKLLRSQQQSELYEKYRQMLADLFVRCGLQEAKNERVMRAQRTRLRVALDRHELVKEQLAPPKTQCAILEQRLRLLEERKQTLARLIAEEDKALQQHSATIADWTSYSHRLRQMRETRKWLMSRTEQKVNT